MVGASAKRANFWHRALRDICNRYLPSRRSFELSNLDNEAPGLIV
jgi:hypothetical protein